MENIVKKVEVTAVVGVIRKKIEEIGSLFKIIINCESGYKFLLYMYP